MYYTTFLFFVSKFKADSQYLKSEAYLRKRVYEIDTHDNGHKVNAVREYNNKNIRIYIFL